MQAVHECADIAPQHGERYLGDTGPESSQRWTMNGLESFGNAQILLYQGQVHLGRAILALLSSILRRR